MEKPATSRRRGGAFAIVAAALIAAQPPFCSSAARQFSVPQFMLLTQVGLLVSVPLLLAGAESRRDFVGVLCAANAARFAAIFAVGTAGLVLYNVSLSGANPVVIVAILNLAPFWAALVARLATKTPIPVSPLVFFGCLAVASAGAVAVAWSQAGDHGGLLAEVRRGTWAFAIPIPVFTALTGTLTAKWFSDGDESGVVAANILVGSLALIPATLVLMSVRGESVAMSATPVLLMIVGIILADAVGRVFTQKALNATGNDNGFVTMFQNLEPAIAALIALGLSPWVEGLRFTANWTFFVGLALTGAALFAFSLKSLRQEAGVGAARPPAQRPLPAPVD